VVRGLLAYFAIQALLSGRAGGRWRRQEGGSPTRRFARRDVAPGSAVARLGRHVAARYGICVGGPGAGRRAVGVAGLAVDAPNANRSISDKRSIARWATYPRHVADRRAPATVTASARYRAVIAFRRGSIAGRSHGQYTTD
jgi:hypothetical protein